MPSLFSVYQLPGRQRDLSFTIPTELNKSLGRGGEILILMLDDGKLPPQIQAGHLYCDHTPLLHLLLHQPVGQHCQAQPLGGRIEQSRGTDGFPAGCWHKALFPAGPLEDLPGATALVPEQQDVLLQLLPDQ